MGVLSLRLPSHLYVFKGFAAVSPFTLPPSFPRLTILIGLIRYIFRYAAILPFNAIIIEVYHFSP